MALPSVTKTWQHNVNLRVANQGTQAANNRRTLRTIKDTLKGFASNGWTVAGSSNGVAFGMDSVDRWTTDADLVFANAGTNHSWVVLKQAGIGANFFICIDLNSAITQFTTCTIVMSVNSAFTGGSLTARPTSTTETVLTSTLWGGDQLATIGADVIIHAQQSSDGQCTRIQTYFNNVRTGLWIFDRVQNVVTGWVVPVYGLVLGNISNVGLDADLFNAANARGYGTTAFNIGMAIESNSARLVSFFAGPNDFDGSYPIFPIGIVSATASHRGRHGNAFDLWAGLVAVTDKDSYPADTSRQFVQFGELVFPWDGSVPVTI